ncbi:hypothetical protein VIGAN_05140900 [Vigna angularis var. angularis]|uniref:Uncharacterized protein n=1 Tax=Vigna angularis var. angularis TaxID=157739 RepID=A0A0S3S568_PHAAN|nr:hypothetical protein VIGAN_05140900 [Vigna angularis var. angularis]
MSRMSRIRINLRSKHKATERNQWHCYHKISWMKNTKISHTHCSPLPTATRLNPKRFSLLTSFPPPPFPATPLRPPLETQKHRDHSSSHRRR